MGGLNGLQLYDRATDRFTNISMKFSDGTLAAPNISTLLERKNGDILIGTAGHSLFELKEQGDTIMGLQTRHLVTSSLIHCIYEDRQENLWIATGDKGIFRIDRQGQTKQYIHENSIALNTVSSICEDEHGRLYIGSLKRGVFVYHPQTDSFRPITYAPNHNLPVKILYPSTHNEIYIGTDGEGMKTYDIQKNESKKPTSIPPYST